ncbi:MAG: ImmA/IrrE family metallo-endopeptidase [Polaribacter sp.]|nr:ImmA/IrrE family metallo-endopeptidase [Polaribacter sp.]
MLNPDVLDWIQGEKKPTLKQLENFTHKVHVPFGYMFMNKPPNEEIPIPFFRTGEAPSEKVSLNVYHTIQIIKERQNWLTNYLKESEYADLDFVGKYNENSNYKVIAKNIRNTLKLPVNWASKFGTWEETLDHLIIHIEEIGIIVNFNGIVGNNTRRKILVDECRGFVLVNKKAPFLFINSADAKAAQMFTLIHELAHIWLGESAGFNNKQMLPADDPIELLCDKVAAEFLVPEIFFIEKWNSSPNIKFLSRVFKVSPIVIARRALDLGLISKTSFFEFYNDYISEFKRKKENQGSGGNFYATAKKRISLRFASYVNNAVNENTLLYRDAYKLTSLKGNTYEKFINEYLFQA